jgi:protein phosphatase
VADDEQKTAEADAKPESAPESAKDEPAKSEPATSEPAKAETKADAEAKSGVVHVEVVGRTEVGQVREHNEDSYLILGLDSGTREMAALRRHDLGEHGTLLVVCDGMGGAAAGEVASNMAIESLAETMRKEGVPPPPEGKVDDGPTSLGRKLRSSARDANTQIFKEARQNLARSGMGTTMTAVLLSGTDAYIAQVGDSRAYVFRAGAFTQVTRDQSLVNQLLESGHITPDQAKFFEHSNVILQALGVQEDVEVQLSRVALRRGDKFLVCSDGLVGVVTDEEIAAVLGAVEDLEDAARMLCELANGAGGPDNITVIVARVGGEALPEPTAADALEYKAWKIDPDVPPPPPADDQPTEPMSQPPDGAVAAREALAAALPQPARPFAELVSMAVVLGLIIGGVVTGAALYTGGVPCQIESQVPGWSVVTDGRDTGARTVEGAVELRLKPGHHTFELRGQGAPAQSQEIDVVRGEACALRFSTLDPER